MRMKKGMIAILALLFTAFSLTGCGVNTNVDYEVTEAEFTAATDFSAADKIAVIREYRITANKSETETYYFDGDKVYYQFSDGETATETYYAKEDGTSYKYEKTGTVWGRTVAGEIPTVDDALSAIQKGEYEDYAYAEKYHRYEMTEEARGSADVSLLHLQFKDGVLCSAYLINGENKEYVYELVYTKSVVLPELPA